MTFEDTVPESYEIDDPDVAALAKHITRLYQLLDHLSIKDVGQDRIETMLSFCSAGEKQLLSRLDAALASQSVSLNRRLTHVNCREYSIILTPCDGGYSFLSVVPRNLS